MTDGTERRKLFLAVGIVFFVVTRQATAVARDTEGADTGSLWRPVAGYTLFGTGLLLSVAGLAGTIAAAEERPSTSCQGQPANNCHTEPLSPRRYYVPALAMVCGLGTTVLGGRLAVSGRPATANESSPSSKNQKTFTLSLTRN